MDNYDLLITKINEFTQKFYLNKLLRGTIYAASFMLAGYLFLFVLVYYTYPSPVAKTVLFFSFILFSLLAIGGWILKPALAYLSLSKTLTLEQSAALIGDHFFNVKDRLLNTLQLKSLADSCPQNSQLIMAGIDQKIGELRPIPFTNAINLKENKKHLKFFLPPLIIILSIGIIAPAILKEGTDSLVKYNEEILPKAPFEFRVANKSLQVIQGDDLSVMLELRGDEFPQDVYIEDGVNTYKLEREKIGRFKHLFKNIQADKTIRFSGGGFRSAAFHITAKPRPSLLDMNAQLVFPAYLNRKNALIKNAGDMLLPEGTKVTWNFHTENSQQIAFILQDQSYNLSMKNEKASFSASIRQSGKYHIIPINTFIRDAEPLNYQITVIADQHPSIAVNESKDSISTKARYFSGSIADDYGFSYLKFNTEISSGGKIIKRENKHIPIRKNQLNDSFFFLWNLNDVQLKPGETLTYFFEVADNDGINGAKISRSTTQTYQAPTQRDIAKLLEANAESLKQKIESTIKLANSIEKDSKKLSRNLLDKQQLGYDDKKQIEQLLAQQQQLDEKMLEVKAQNEKNNIQQFENQVLNEEIRDKQKKIDDLFNNVLDEQAKALLQKLQRLMELNNKDQAREELSKMQLDNKFLKNELDRILSLYKQLDFEQSLQNKIDRLDKLSKDQKDLSAQAEDKRSAMDGLKSKQNQLQKDFQGLKKEIADLSNKNQALEKPNDFENPEGELKQIEEQQVESQEELSRNDRQQAAAKQRQAAEQMQQLAQKMKEDRKESEQEEDKTNVSELRGLLKNLINTSFQQEKVMLALKRMSSNDPSYITNVQQQNTIKDNMKTMADSLNSLSKRVPQIESVVNTEVQKINFNISKAIDFLGDRRTAEANRSQQFAMTSLNNLSLMLNEVLESLQNAQKNAKSGEGKGKKGMKELQQMQDQLNRQMQQAKDQLQREGNKGSVPKGAMSKEFAKMAQQQQIIREALQQINKTDNKDGRGSLGNLNELAKEMKQTELDLVNKRLTAEALTRQKNLHTKLLDAEKAEREQDQDSKRESSAAKDYPPSYKKMLENYRKSQQTESEILQKVPLNLNYYYKNRIAEYFKLLNLQKQ